MTDLTGRVAIVTGAGKGIGFATAARLAAAGATVYLADIDHTTAASAGETIGGRALALDVTKPSQWSNAVEQIAAEAGRLDILVNNAGIMRVIPFLETTLEDYRVQHKINVEGTWIGMQACYALLSEGAKTTPGSSIINLSSIYGQLGGRGVAGYAATKGAIRLLTKAVAVEFAELRSGIRVNSVHPGPVNTDLLRDVVKGAVAGGVIADIDQGMSFTAAQHPVGRMAEAADIADAIVFLASDASRFMTGTEIVVDGGYSIV